MWKAGVPIRNKTSEACGASIFSTLRIRTSVELGNTDLTLVSEIKLDILD